MELIRIALADDHAILRKGLAELINSMPGLQIIMDADNGADLMRQLDKAVEMPHLCILDINMPEMNGYQTARAIRTAYPEIRILALSMFEDEFNIIKMLRAGAQGYLLKNVQPEEMGKAIRDVHLQGYYYSGPVTGKLVSLMQKESSTADELSKVEEEFLGYCCTELTYKEIAERMFKSPRTIDNYRDSLFSKLGVTSRTGLVLYALKTGIGEVR